jgi:hypothetical protein
MKENKHIITEIAKQWLLVNHIESNDPEHKAVLDFAVWCDKFINDEFEEKKELN